MAVEVFEGNTNDTTTLSQQIEKVRSRFGLKRVIWVGDRGMITSTRIAYYVEWHLKRALASLLFMDEDWELKKKDKTDVVSPAKRSEKALKKVRRKKTEENLPVHSFSTLMADLGTITLNTIQSKLDGNLISFEKITQPTVLQ